LLYGRSYYLVPEATAVKAYALLMKAMQHSQRIAIARIVMRQREHLCAVRPVKGHIVISTLRYAEELVSLSELKFPAADGAPRKRELEMAEQLIASMSTTFHPRRYRDDYRQKVADLLRRKASGETLAPSPPSDEEELPRSLEEALAASLEEVQHRPAIDRSGSRQAPRHATAVAHRKTAFKDDGSSSPHH
jgi:DNA end-binding protein Ku